MNDPVGIVVLLAVALAAWWWFRRGGGVPRGAESQLRRICLGNDSQMERLISGELARSPGISRAEAASRAVERYRRDNR